MQTLSFLNHLHLANRACFGYENYIKNKQEGRWVMFNPYFLLFQGFYLIYHKMYRETFLYCLLFGFYFSLGINVISIEGKMALEYSNLYLCFFLIITTIFISNFFFYRIYEMHNERLMYKVNYDPQEYIKASEPYSNIISLIAMVFGHTFMIWTLLFGLMLFSSFK